MNYVCLTSGHNFIITVNIKVTQNGQKMIIYSVQCLWLDSPGWPIIDIFSVNVLKHHGT